MYYIHGIIMILLPLSIFLFLLIIVIKLVCFLLADNNGVLRGDLRRGSKRYGQFDDDVGENELEDNEAVISHYLKIIQR